MSLAQVPLTLIAAATAKNGIGKSGGLPWPMLKKDMAYFARVTKRVPPFTKSASNDESEEDLKKQASRRNVVIMGRKTWDSIPQKFRPLKDRTHIVISSQDRSKLDPLPPDDVVVAADISSGLQSLQDLIQAGKAPPVGRAFVIGGSSIYKAALELRQTNSILLTRISKEYDCDTFFPESLGGDSSPSAWQRASHTALKEFVGEDVDEGEVVDGDVGLDFQLYQRS
ncbi:related to DFR1-dihydrofolate reductase [Ramularia collo-cygni]|uniref:Dihydrofolate reductase n=1 Tax=Ramularia collo-cygni TaxID=112498 RepID=A0A2D3V4L9_9PEZI|nr:related to DFR1-dihydrofolate reductase [Ramularia collo-cygni]CZT24326.1 related to DFR1-dihydrofolate reductase [Ramularia collo-cygni]